MRILDQPSSTPAPKPAKARKPTREEIALVEVGQTTIGPRTVAAMIAAFLAVIVAVPAIDTVLQLRSGGLPAVAALGLLRTPPALSDFTFPIHAATEAETNPFIAYEKKVEKASDLRSSTQRTLQHAFTGWFGLGNAQVVVGTGGWLYYRPGLDYLGRRGFLSPDQHLISGRRHGDPRPAVRAVQAACRAAGVRLILLPIPDKAMIHPEHLGGPKGAAWDNPDRARWQAELEAEGIEFLSCEEIMRTAAATSEAFLRQDTHWTPTVMDAVARALASHLSPGGNVWTSTEVAVTNHGDLVGTLLLPMDQTLFPTQSVTVAQVRDRAGNTWQADRSAPLLLLGDSFTNIFHQADMGWGEGAGLAARLAFHAGAAVDLIAVNGGGASGALTQLARRPQPLAGKQVVIWQFAIRDLAAVEWPVIDLTGKAESAEPSAAASDDLVVIGTIASPVPRPSTTMPYQNARVVLILDQLTVERGSAAGSRLLISLPAMEGRRLLPASDLRPGDRIRCEVRKNIPALWQGRSVLDQTNELSLGEPSWSERWARVGSIAGDPHSLPITASRPVVPATDPGPAISAIPSSVPSLAALDSIARERLAGPATRVDAGVNGWLFLRDELQHLARGDFWGEAMARQWPDPAEQTNRDPLPALLRLHRELTASGIALVVVPVPAKAAIYPDRLDSRLAAPTAPPDTAARRFTSALAAQGVTVVDLHPVFASARSTDDADGPVYCRTDSHWTPRGAGLAANAVAAALQIQPWYATVAPVACLAQPAEITAVIGDLSSPGIGPEEIRFSRVMRADGQPILSTTAPVLLLGDSHAMVFSDGGDMHTVGAGFVDRLALALQLPIERIANKGSASTIPRMTVYRTARQDPAWLAGKKVVVYLFTVRELTEAINRWPPLPLSPAFKESAR